MTFRACSAILLAGGFSSRMGRFKPLLPLGDSTVVEHIIGAFQQTGIHVILVGGYNLEELFSVARAYDVTLVENPGYSHGMLSSVKKGVEALPPGCRSFFVLPVDIPLVRPQTVERTLNISRENPGCIIYPAVLGRRGHPPLIPASLGPDILAWNGEGGLKALLERHKDMAFEVPVPDRGILLDIDTPADYENVMRRYETCGLPDDDEIEAVIEILQVPPDRVAHGKAVAAIAASLAEELLKTGHRVDIGLVRAAALLHDIAKGKPRHDETGGQILRDMGFGPVADIVSVHSDLGGMPVQRPSLEARVVYLADKFVKGEDTVSLDERYRISQVQYGKDPDIEQRIAQRKQRAMQVKSDIEVLIGESVDSVILHSK